jgi:cyclophilin family peptidyl-prolyl cis-trans isomerase
MSVERNAIRFDAFTALGLGIVLWLGVTAWILLRPPSGIGGVETGSAVAAAEPPAEQGEAAENAVVTESKPMTQEEAKAAMAATKEQPENPIVRIETSHGVILARLFVDKAPKTAENFIDLVKQSFYDGIIFHRVIKDFMIQTGDPLGRGIGGREEKGLPPKKLLDEFHPQLRHDRPGVLSMANAGPNTGDTQFFITTVPTPWLDDKHAIFGEVVSGMDVVKKLESVPTGGQDRPRAEIKMIKVQMVDAAEAEKLAGS